MVTKPNTPMPATSTPMKPHPTKIEPPKTVSGAGLSLGSDKDVANKDRSADNKFELPEKVTPSEIKDNSFRYGGGRSAGNRSLADNIARKIDQP